MNTGQSYMKVKNVDEALPHICIKLQVHDVPKIGLCYTLNDLKQVLPKDVLREMEAQVTSYNPEFLQNKMDNLLDKISNTPELLNVFKRLNDR